LAAPVSSSAFPSEGCADSRSEEVPVEDLLAGKAHPEIDEYPRITVFQEDLVSTDFSDTPVERE